MKFSHPIGVSNHYALIALLTLAALLGLSTDSAAQVSDEDEYPRHESLIVVSGGVRLFNFVTFGSSCIDLTGSTVHHNGDQYMLVSTRWQTRANSSNAWADIPGTSESGRLCAYTPVEPGEYRMVAELAINGVVGKYSSNILVVSETFDLDADNRSADEIMFANDRFYVVDTTDEKVYAYQASGQRDPASDFDLDADNVDADGITFANDRFYVVDDEDDKVYAYHSSGQRDPASDFDLDADNGNADGITFTNDRFYVVDAVDDKVYAHHASGERDSASDFDLDSANDSAAGITFANDRFYVVDDEDRKVYAYHASGQRDSASDFDLFSDNSWPIGITFANDRFYVVNFDLFGGNDIYVYGGPTEVPAENTQPSFGAATVADQDYEAATAISPLTLPQASGGGGALIYSLMPEVPGLSFDAVRRRLTGTPTSAGTYNMTYRVADADGDTDTLNFTITVMVPVTTTATGTESFSIPNLGGWSTTSNGTGESVRVGYGRIRAEAGSTTPSGIAIFQFRDSEGVLISEAGVPASEPVREGRIFAEVNGPVNTGLAIANPNDVPATIQFYFTDTSGTRFADGSVELGAHQQTAKFLDQEPFNSGSSVLGTFTFTSSVPVAVVALRGFTNEAGEFLMTTLPVAPLSSTSSDTVYFPHFADGNGWATQLILVNPTDRTITGTVAFLGQGSGAVAASPVVLALDDGSTVSDFDYSIPPRSVQKFTTSNPTGRLAVGSVRATPSSGNAAPSGLVVFSYAQDGKTVSEAGVPALPKGTAFRAYVEASGTPEQAGSIRSGLAITNTASTSNTVTLEVTRLDGSLAVAPSTLSLPPSGQVARFLDQVFSLPDNFSGVLRVTSTTEVAMVALRLRVNERGELKMTTTSPSNEMDPSTSQDRFFAHLADSGGWSTQFILFSGTAGQTSSGTLSFIDTAGEPWDLPTATVLAADTSPSFGTATVSNTTYTVGTAISALTLPTASGGDGTLTYSLSPAVAGLRFSSATRQLTGTPSTAGTYAMTYIVTDEDGDTDMLSFIVTVEASDGGGDGDGSVAGTFDWQVDDGNGVPAGIAHVNDRFYVVDWPDNKVYAYTESGERDAAADFDLDPDNGHPSGITYANGRFYVADDPRNVDSSRYLENDNKVYAYTESGERDAAADFDLDGVNGSPADIVYANARFYVPDWLDEKVYAYTASGERDAAADFDLHADNGYPDGMTYAKGRFYVVDASDRKVYAYTESGERDAAADFDSGAFNYSPRWIAYANGRFYVVNWFNLHVYAYTDSGERDAVAEFALPGDNQAPWDIVYVNGRFYVLDTSDYKVYAYTQSGQRDTAAEFDLHADNGNPYGMTYANGRFYVVNPYGDDNNKVYAYTASGERDAAADFDLHADNGYPYGMTYANGRFYVVDADDDKVYAYADSGERDAAADFLLHEDNGPGRITYANGRFYVVNQGRDNVNAYTDSGERDAAADFRLHDDNHSPFGISYADGWFYVLDIGLNKVFAYPGPVEQDGNETSYGVGDTITTLPAGVWFPDVTSGASFILSGGNAVVSLNNGGYIEEEGYRYTCQNAGGCEIRNRQVVSGTIIQTSTTTTPEDTQPSFAGASGPGNQSYTVGTAISALTLPTASGGDGTLTYSLSPTVAGLTFSSATRRLTGTPTAAGTYNMTYTARDADGDLATLNFVVTVATTQMTTVDLVVTSVSASDNTLEVGQSFDLTATTINRGTGTAAATTLRFYRSTDTTISSSDTEVGTDAVNALTAGGTSSSVLTLTAPSTAGTYYYGACVDPVSGESATGNNCSSAVRVTAAQVSDEDVYVRHESLTIARGWVRYFRFQTGVGSCIDLTGSTVLDNGVPYILISSKWQTRANSSDAWADIPDTSESGRLCAYDPVDPGEYRLVAEISIAGQVGKYSSNILGDRFFLASANTDASGITYANTRFFVVDWGEDRVYAYDAAGQRDSASDFRLYSGFALPQGIAFANDRFYVLDWRDEKVYAHHASGRRDSASDFDLDPDNRLEGGDFAYSGAGITFANDKFYVVNTGGNVYAYQATGQRDSASDFALDSANTSPQGITFANGRFFVVDRVDAKVYAYHSSGQRDSARDFDLNLDNDDARGITFANDRFYVVDDADTVFVYKR